MASALAFVAALTAFVTHRASAGNPYPECSMGWLRTECGQNPANVGTSIEAICETRCVRASISCADSPHLSISSRSKYQNLRTQCDAVAQHKLPAEDPNDCQKRFMTFETGFNNICGDSNYFTDTSSLQDRVNDGSLPHCPADSSCAKFFVKYWRDCSATVGQLLLARKAGASDEFADKTTITVPKMAVFDAHCGGNGALPDIGLGDLHVGLDENGNVHQLQNGAEVVAEVRRV